jgi:hypothetical protein
VSAGFNSGWGPAGTGNFPTTEILAFLDAWR